MILDIAGFAARLKKFGQYDLGTQDQGRVVLGDPNDLTGLLGIKVEETPKKQEAKGLEWGGESGQANAPPVTSPSAPSGRLIPIRVGFNVYHVPEQLMYDPNFMARVIELQNNASREMFQQALYLLQGDNMAQNSNATRFSFFLTPQFSRWPSAEQTDAFLAAMRTLALLHGNATREMLLRNWYLK